MIIYQNTKGAFFMKKILILLLTLSVTFIFIGVLPIHGEAEIYDSVLRLHVVANSDSDADQSLKLAVRDKIIAGTRSLFSDADTLEKTTAIVDAHMEDIYNIAKEEIVAKGYDYEVEIRLGKEQYPRKTYASLCFPAGEYLSLQVLIGKAEGQNWWCVLFPPLCLDAASEVSTNEDAFISVGLTGEQYKIITETKNPTYKARFKLLEVIENGITW